ncbi:hypothetical protein OY671_007574, partial [Metschnikowia pulcherrima]
RQGVSWRSGQHGDATVDDLDAVHRSGIATVIDLRGDSEREACPCSRHPEFEGHVSFHPGETASAHGRAAHEEAAEQVRTAADAHAAMIRLYETSPFRPVSVGTYRLYSRASVDRDGASSSHCSAGKDRTGVAAASVHHSSGVHPDDIVEDYSSTNTAGNAEARIAAGARHVRAGFGRHMDDAAVRVSMSVHADYLDTSLAAIREQHGSVEAYADAVSGFGKADIAASERRSIV